VIETTHTNIYENESNELPSFCKQYTNISFTEIFEKKKLSINSFLPLVASQIADSQFAESQIFMLVIIHRAYALKLFLGLIHLDRNHGCLQD
jgi:hypothetical protein